MQDGKYDTYKGSTHRNFVISLPSVFEGNMILIKDRHWNMYQQMVSFQIGKYDTYKGSTPSFKSSALKLKDSGKYDTYKGSTRQSMNKR